MSRFPNVSFIILNFNGAANVLECVASAYASSYPSFNVIVVDNGSSDNSVARLCAWANENSVALIRERACKGTLDQSRTQEWVEGRALIILEAGSNLGFSKGNNLGIAFAMRHGAEYVFMLNNDVMVRPDTLPTLVATMEGNTRMGALYPQVVGVDGKLQVPVELRPSQSFWELLLESNLLGVFWSRFSYRAILRRKSPYKDYKYDRVVEVPNIVIGCSLYRTQLFEAIGLLDEKIFMYSGEHALLERMQGSGFVSCFDPSTSVVHKGGGDISKLSLAWVYLRRVCDELYYAKQYMQANRLQIYLLKALRMAYYCYYMAKSHDFRDRFPAFFREYMLGHGPAS